jgi:chloride channel protein, CIC family
MSRGGRESQLALVLSLVIGALVGLVLVAFILLTGRLAARLYPPGGSGVRRVLVPLIGSLIIGVILFRWFPDARGSGIPRPRPRSSSWTDHLAPHGPGKVLPLLYLAGQRDGIGARGVCGPDRRRTGLGHCPAPRPEQAIRQGAGAGGRRRRAGRRLQHPIAAVLFSLEEIMGDLHPILGSVVLSSATSWMALHLVRPPSAEEEPVGLVLSG